LALSALGAQLTHIDYPARLLNAWSRLLCKLTTNLSPQLKRYRIVSLNHVLVSNCSREPDWYSNVLENLRLQHPQLSAEIRDTGACNLRHPLIAGVGRHLKKVLHPLASGRRNNAELGKMGSDRLDHGGLLANEQMARAM
jgi:hypothetical protein